MDPQLLLWKEERDLKAKHLDEEHLDEENLVKKKYNKKLESNQRNIKQNNYRNFRTISQCFLYVHLGVAGRHS